MDERSIELLNETLDEASADVQAEVFPGTFHGLTVLDASYDGAAAEAHYKRVEELMRSALVPTA